MTVKLRTQLLWLTTTLICKKLYAFVATQSSTPYSRTYFMDGPVLVTSLQKIFFNLSHLSSNDEIWHSYTLRKEDPKNM